jgi:hypothetical protein
MARYLLGSQALAQLNTFATRMSSIHITNSTAVNTQSHQ